MTLVIVLLEPLDTRGEAHKLSGMGGRERNEVNCVAVEGWFDQLVVSYIV